MSSKVTTAGSFVSPNSEFGHAVGNEKDLWIFILVWMNDRYKFRPEVPDNRILRMEAIQLLQMESGPFGVEFGVWSGEFGRLIRVHFDSMRIGGRK